MQGELSECSTYLHQAIAYLETKLEALKATVPLSSEPSTRGSQDLGLKAVNKALTAKKASQGNIRGYVPAKKTTVRPQKSWIGSAMSNEAIEKATHLIRHQCRFTLQLCAVLSQLNEHDLALEFSKRSSNLAKDLSHLTQILVTRELNGKSFESKPSGSRKHLRETTVSNYQATSQARSKPRSI